MANKQNLRKLDSVLDRYDLAVMWHAGTARYYEVLVVRDTGPNLPPVPTEDSDTQSELFNERFMKVL